jgi:peptidyl-prolyl cis-trans isomerase D
MLKILRDNLKYLSWILWVVILVFIAFVFVDFGGGLSPGGGSRQLAARVGEREISRREFENHYRNLERRYRQAFGGQWNAELADRMQLPLQALEQLVDRELLAIEAERRGLAAGDADVQRAILAIDGLTDGSGNFVGEEAYLRALRGIGTTPREFEAELREQIAVERLRDLLEASVAVSDAEVERTWREANENASIRYLLAPTARFQGEAAPTPAEIEAHFAEHADAFRLPDQRIVDYLLVDAAALRAEIVLDRSELEREYARRRSEFETGEQVRARHILVKVDENRSAEEAARRIAEARAKIERGEPFETVAAAYSDDPGSRDRGGDLGTFGRGAMVPPFEEAAFGARPGKLVGPVETGFGLHLIEVLAQLPPRVRAFEEVEGELRARLAGERSKEAAARRARDLAARIAAEKPRGEEGWKALADGRAVQFLTTPPFGESDPVPGIGRNPQFAAAAFALGPDAPGVASPPVEVARGWAILRLREERPAHVPPLAEVEPRVRAAVQREQANRLAEAALVAAQAQLAAGRSLEEVAQALDLEVRESGEFTRAGSIAGLGAARALADAALAAAPGAIGGPVVLPQGAVLFQLVAKSGFDTARFAAERETTRAQLKEQETERLLAAVLRELRARIGVEYDRDLAERLKLAGTSRTL